MPVQLVQFLMQLVNETVFLELKNGTTVEGTVVGVDPSMNTYLKKVKVTLKGKAPLEMDTMSVRGTSLRYFHLSEDSLLPKLDSMLEKTLVARKAAAAADDAPPRAERGRGRGGDRGGRGGGRGFRGGRGGDRGSRGR